MPQAGNRVEDFVPIVDPLLCSGAINDAAFHNNDRPGIMLAGAMRSYVNRFAVTIRHCPLYQ